MNNTIYIVEVKRSDDLAGIYEEFDTLEQAKEFFNKYNLTESLQLENIAYVGYYSKKINKRTHMLVNDDIMEKINYLVSKYGMSETAYKLHISRQFLYNIVNKRNRYINKKVVQLLHAKTE